ncbi:MAG: hypothetical protein LBV08_03415 [Clostridiales bacterium]|jgi:hypothetical protein|nr:hypothetical protein [Clostridiales bacterium]
MIFKIFGPGPLITDIAHKGNGEKLTLFSMLLVLNAKNRLNFVFSE